MVVDARGVESHAGSGRATAEQVHATSFPDAPDGLLPRHGFPNGFKDGVWLQAVQIRGGGITGGLKDLMGTQPAGGIQPGLVAPDDRHRGSKVDGQSRRHESDGTRANDGEVIARLQAEVSDALDHAGKRFCERCVDEGKIGGDVEEIPGDDAGRDDDGLGVCPVEEEEIVAEVFLAPATGSTGAAGSRVRGDNAIAWLPVRHGRMDFGDDPGELVAEDAGWDQHAGVVAASEHLEVRATRQGGPDADADLTLLKNWIGQAFKSDILHSMEYGGVHS